MWPAHSFGTIASVKSVKLQQVSTRWRLCHLHAAEPPLAAFSISTLNWMALCVGCAFISFLFTSVCSLLLELQLRPCTDNCCKQEACKWSEPRLKSDTAESGSLRYQRCWNMSPADVLAVPSDDEIFPLNPLKYTLLRFTGTVSSSHSIR